MFRLVEEDLVVLDRCITLSLEFIERGFDIVVPVLDFAELVVASEALLEEELLPVVPADEERALVGGSFTCSERIS